MKSKTTAAVIALLFGWMGGQFFYLKQPGWGIVMLLICWSGIPLVIGIIDFFTLLFMSQEQFYFKHNNGTYVINSNNNVAEELERLHRLKQEGVLTQKEFDTRKKLLLKNS